MTYKKIIEAKDALIKISNQDLSVKSAVRLARMIKSIDKELELFREQHIKISEKYGKEVDGESFKIEECNVEEFNKSVKELLDTETENDYTPIDIDTDVKLTATEVIQLEDFINFNVE